MSADNVSHVKEGDLHPEEPLRLIKFLVISSDGTLSYALKLRTTPTKLLFKNVGYLIGNTLTFVIPKYVTDSSTIPQLYQVSVNASNINIVDTNDKAVPFNIISPVDGCVYYLNIAIKDSLACYEDLTLTFNQFDLALTTVISPTQCSLPILDQWRWFPSVVQIQ